ncbi:MAG: MMPL family transporter, partial [Acidimicrobiaceae bacterium]|nr:MMPL family transporter [Acidimicrobiaceae bacterium]
MYKALGKWCFRHPWRVLGAWLATAVAVGIIAGGLGPSFGAEISSPDSESGRAADILGEHFGSVGSRVSGTIVLDATEAADGVGDPQIRAAMTALLADVGAITDVSVGSPYEAGGAHRIADTGPTAGRIAYADVETAPGFNVDESIALSADIEHLIDSSGLREIPGVQVHIGGAWLAEQEPPETEAIGLAFAIFVLIAAVGSVVAMGVTVGTALLGVGIGAMGIVIISNVTTVPDFASTIGVMIGIGVGIDYALFIINRFREWVRHGLDLPDAVGAALDSAGRSVVFAGATVVLSLLGLLVVGLPFVSGLGISAAVTVAIVMAGSITLLPAVLGLVGNRLGTIRVRGIAASALVALALLGFGLGIMPLLVGIPAAVAVIIAGSFAKHRNRLRRVIQQRPPKALRETAWYRLSRVVQARPWAGALGGVALLLLLAAPVLGL